VGGFLPVESNRSIGVGEILGALPLPPGRMPVGWPVPEAGLMMT
jgi:hypothetical protein